MKSVVYILDSFPKASEAFVLNEILAVQNKGVKTTVCAFSGPQENEIQHAGVELVDNIIYFKKTTFLQKIIDHCLWMFKHPIKYLKAAMVILRKENHLKGIFLRNLGCVKYVIEARPDILHAHFASRASDMALLVHLFSGHQFTFTTHRYDIFDIPAKNFPIKTRLAKKHITISDYNRKYLVRQFGLNESDIEIVHCGVDLNKIKLIERNSEEGLILTVARLAPEKSIDVLLQALSLLDAKNVDFKAAIIGDGPLKKEIQDIIQSLMLSGKVYLLGNQSHEQVLEWMGKASMVVLSSKSEGIPVSLMEAMAIKTPVIATKITGIPELIDDCKSGLLVEYNDAEALSAAIEKLLKDNTMRLNFTEAGYEKIQDEFDLNREVDKLIEIWFGTDHNPKNKLGVNLSSGT
jgi:glycosyltransferase involved in cell wall biosynthesis